MINNLVCAKNEIRIIAGPCAVEDDKQMDKICSCIASLGLKYVRGGAYKPRHSPHSFQGLGFDGIKILKSNCDKHNLYSVSEVVDKKSLLESKDNIDVLQIGTRNMTNYSLLTEVGHVTKNTEQAVIFKRGMSAKISEWLMACEYISMHGNGNIILCERGLRSFEDSTRFTLDISAVPVVHRQSLYPICVDVSHAAGNAWMVPDLAKAALAAGADAIMLETHPSPKEAKCDGSQQLDLESFKNLIFELQMLAKAIGKKIV